MGRYCEICKCNSYEKTKGESELEDAKLSVTQCSDCGTQYCQEHYDESECPKSNCYASPFHAIHSMENKKNG